MRVPEANHVQQVQKLFYAYVHEIDPLALCVIIFFKSWPPYRFTCGVPAWEIRVCIVLSEYQWGPPLAALRDGPHYLQDMSDEWGMGMNGD